MSIAFNVVFSFLIFVGFGIYDYVFLPVISLFMGPSRKLPVKAKVQKKLEFIDEAFIAFNKLVSILFVFHCVQLAQSYTSCDVSALTGAAPAPLKDAWAQWVAPGVEDLGLAGDNATAAPAVPAKAKAFGAAFIEQKAQEYIEDERMLWWLEDPMVQSLLRFPVHLVAILIIYDLVYTALHWALHIPFLYPLIHKHHHRQLVPIRGNIDAINVNPIEYVLGEYNHLFAVFVATKVFGGDEVLGGIHAMTFLLYVALAGTLSSLNHTRTDIHIPYVYAVWWHDYHHRQPRCNYGQYIMLWDWAFGTFIPRSADTTKPIKQE